MELNYRSAKSEDLESLVALLSNDPLGSQREDASIPLNSAYLEAFEAIMRDPNNELLVVEFEHALVGMLQVTFIPYLTHIGSWRCLIEGVRIHSDYRRQGLGEQMFAHAIELAKSKGCTIVQLTSDKQRPDAIRFYEKLGFKATHEGFKLVL
ncbi:putative Acyl-CoA N-acyltransferase [Vibrio nigripulchritudo MADA3029]|uniref:GNAT family N-acetyltransferase n=1 Tax=Vibrio nigripulchritudo TaxID=28173 RepID=UPI0003B20DE2|nr:GNAT family N-acetyltransferase [Vibrio nigripulchritudo]CCN45874.1 putative Acyl-CoA N-acyltransferase [Vibrio nigripulchritudo MADA3020]CCN56075.1 putative Acyl-CoA N-acyltransferase [Vibrio nigripulchritudo MADA3021]CCN59818.1 putative Acyl-CoA N-acyltransferase [Vibrio nigripulchritudo MADA3029]